MPSGHGVDTAAHRTGSDSDAPATAPAETVAEGEFVAKAMTSTEVAGTQIGSERLNS